MVFAHLIKFSGYHSRSIQDIKKHSSILFKELKNISIKKFTYLKSKPRISSYLGAMTSYSRQNFKTLRSNLPFSLPQTSSIRRSNTQDKHRWSMFIPTLMSFTALLCARLVETLCKSLGNRQKPHMFWVSHLWSWSCWCGICFCCPMCCRNRTSPCCLLPFIKNTLHII